ncbi:MAG: hypothetical protein R3F20_11035 [Planctomycetota bacterium]
MNSIFRQPGARWALFLFTAAVLVQFAPFEASAITGSGCRAARGSIAPPRAGTDPPRRRHAMRPRRSCGGASIVGANVRRSSCARGALFERAMRSSSRLVVGSGVVVSADGYVITNAHDRAGRAGAPP